MIHVLERLWPALAAAAALGAVFAAVGGPGRRLPSAGWPARAVALAVLAGAAVASALRVVPGAAGLWLDLGVLLGIAYLSGIAGTAIVRRLAGGRAQDREEDGPAGAEDGPAAGPSPAA